MSKIKKIKKGKTVYKVGDLIRKRLYWSYVVPDWNDKFPCDRFYIVIKIRPNITRPDITRPPFDDEKYYCMDVLHVFSSKPAPVHPSWWQDEQCRQQQNIIPEYTIPIFPKTTKDDRYTIISRMSGIAGEETSRQ